MARVRMVTRTIEVIELTTLCVEVATATTTFKQLELTGVGSLDDAGLLKLLKKQYETDELKVVAITNKTTREELYGLTELEFLNYATRLDPETRKVLELEEATEEPAEPEATKEPEELEIPEEPKPKKSRKK